MPSAKRKPSQTVETWATHVLLQAHAIAPCETHGFMRLKHHHAAIEYAHALAAHEPYPGMSKPKCVAAIDEVLDGLGDECPACS
jgi:hypothetical protein